MLIISLMMWSRRDNFEGARVRVDLEKSAFFGDESKIWPNIFLPLSLWRARYQYYIWRADFVLQTDMGLNLSILFICLNLDPHKRDMYHAKKSAVSDA